MFLKRLTILVFAPAWIVLLYAPLALYATVKAFWLYLLNRDVSAFLENKVMDGFVFTTLGKYLSWIGIDVDA